MVRSIISQECVCQCDRKKLQSREVDQSPRQSHMNKNGNGCYFDRISSIIPIVNNVLSGKQIS